MRYLFGCGTQRCLKTKFIDKKLSETWHANDLGPIEFDGNMLCSEWEDKITSQELSL